MLFHIPLLRPPANAAQSVLREGMQAGGGRELPAEYRPDYAMLEEYYRALSRLHRMTDMVLQDERAVRLAVSAVWYRVQWQAQHTELFVNEASSTLSSTLALALP